MFLFKTICSTDWKGRPAHSVNLIVQTDSLKEAVEAMNKDVLQWMAEDIASSEAMDRYENGEEDLVEIEYVKKRVPEILRTMTPGEINERWEIKNERWEMQVGTAREFVWMMGDGVVTGIVYHFMTDVFTYVDRDEINGT